MKIVFFGTPITAVPILNTLNKIKGIEVIAAVTQIDRKAGRGKKNTLSPVKILAEKLEIKVIQAQDTKELEKKLDKMHADFFVVVAYGMILPKSILAIPKYGSINVHFSLLPKYRGASPVQEALLKGDKKTGISIIRMNEKLDEGDILFVKRVNIEEKDTQESLMDRLTKLTMVILPLMLSDTMAGIISAIPQSKNSVSYCKKIKKQDGKISWNFSAEEINNRIRAYTPWPSTFTEIKGKKLKILKAEIDKSNKLQPGEFLIENKELKIGTKNGLLIPKEVQLEGKKKMDIKSFLNGYKSLFE